MRANTIFGIAVGTALFSGVAFAGPSDDLRFCSQLGAKDERVACFQAVRRLHGPGPKGNATTTASGAIASSYAVSAPDFPIRARPIKYVRVCSIYGAGFYYIPGSGTCIKLSGYVRIDAGINGTGNDGPYLRDDGSFREGRSVATRATFSLDARSQTEWGTLRAYMRGGWELRPGDAYSGVNFFDRAFIQFGGLTLGKTQSFFGFYANALNYSPLQGGGQSDAGLNLIAYTAQFAHGFSGAVSLEDALSHRGFLQRGASAGVGRDYDPVSHWPDIVANIRVDQLWGSAQISAVLREVRSNADNDPIAAPISHTAVGFAIQGGLKFNLPWAQGDELWMQGTWARGASHYLGWNPLVHTPGYFALYSGAGGNQSAGLAWPVDGAFDANGMALTEGWSVLLAAQHYWTPGLRTSVFGHYTRLNFGGDGVANPDSVSGKICNGPPLGALTFIITAKCNFDFAVLQVGSRTIWSPTADLDIGVEVLYTRLEQSFNGTAQLSASGTHPAGVYVLRDQDTWSGTVRFQHNF